MAGCISGVSNGTGDWKYLFLTPKGAPCAFWVLFPLLLLSLLTPPASAWASQERETRATTRPPILYSHSPPGPSDSALSHQQPPWVSWLFGGILAGLVVVLSVVELQRRKIYRHRQALEEESQKLEAEIIDHRRTQADLERLYRYDPLTELPNRQFLREKLRESIGAARRLQHKMALLFLDIDDFKKINDSLGLQAGDSLLREMGQRLQRIVREGDTVARHGNDQFTLILTHLDDLEKAVALIRRISAHLKAPFQSGGTEFFITVSVGATFFPADGANVSTLLENAASALNHAKRQGRDGIEFYSQHLTQRIRHQLATETGLRYALEEDGLLIHYQPQVKLDTGEVTAAEALVRWQNQGGVLVSPAKFISLAEETGLILPLGDRVLALVCRQLRQWDKEQRAPLRIAVNLSAPQLRQPGLVKRLLEILDSHEISPSRIELEITESTLMEHSDRNLKLLNQLRKLGFRVALDDFGTGYSSLSYLKHFPVDTLKIDGSFLKDIGTEKGAALASAIIAMAHSLNITVLAEGVETPQQARFLESCHCESAQGYLYSPPRPGEDFAVWLAARTPKQTNLIDQSA